MGIDERQRCVLITFDSSSGSSPRVIKLMLTPREDRPLERAYRVEVDVQSKCEWFS